tara:strand:+ start:105 stop:365 length:261 start_codon:yes stop_codon:yes gene_type:complete
MINQEIRNRIRLSVAAYAYEFVGDSIMSDQEYDELSLKINPKEKTGNDMMDKFFRTQFQPDTGMWIRTHPEIKKLEYLYKKYYKTS